MEEFKSHPRSQPDSGYLPGPGMVNYAQTGPQGGDTGVLGGRGAKVPERIIRRQATFYLMNGLGCSLQHSVRERR